MGATGGEKAGEADGGIRSELRSEPAQDGLIDELALTHPRIGMAGLLRSRGRRGRAVRASAPAVTEAFRWGLLDGWSTRWWPQGVEVLTDHDDSDRRDELLVISWFAQERRGSTQGARISVIDRRDPRRPRYHHVLLVEPVRDAAGRATFAPIAIHAGGLARLGDQLYAAATYGGLRRFDLRDILLVSGRRPFGYRCVLPQAAHERLRTSGGAAEPAAVAVLAPAETAGAAAAEARMRFSFVSLERSRAGDDEHLVVGEFGPHREGRRLGRVPVGAAARAAPRVEVIDVHEPGIPRMQGAAVIDGTWFVSASNGLKPGDLWVGSPADGSSAPASEPRWTRHRAVLPAGPEDLAVSVDGRRLWSLCEYPRRRAVYAIDAERWRDAPDTPA